MLIKSLLTPAACVAATCRGVKPPWHTLWREPQAGRSVQVTLRAQKGERTTRRAGNDAKGVRTKFRNGVARAEQWGVLNFDLTPFASLPHLLPDPLCSYFR